MLFFVIFFPLNHRHYSPCSISPVPIIKQTKKWRKIQNEKNSSDSIFDCEIETRTKSGNYQWETQLWKLENVSHLICELQTTGRMFDYIINCLFERNVVGDTYGLAI